MQRPFCNPLSLTSYGVFVVGLTIAGTNVRTETMTRLEEPNLNIDESPIDAGNINAGDEGLHIPNLFWAALLIFSVNLMIVIWFYFSPGFTIRLD